MTSTHRTRDGLRTRRAIEPPGLPAARGVGAAEPTARTIESLPRRLDGGIDIDAAVAALSPCDLLESADGSGWSYVVPHGGPVLLDDGRRTRLVHGDADPTDLGTDPFAAIDTVCEHYGIVPDADVDPALPGFTGGLVGALAYDLGRRREGLPGGGARDPGALDLHLRVAELVVAIDSDRERALLITRPLLAADGLPDRTEEVLSRLATARTSGPDVRMSPQRATSHLSRAAYLGAVSTILDHIRAGDCFQVNFTQRLTARWGGDTHGLYRALRGQSPAPYGASMPDIGLASISPETFLAVDGRTVTTRPIKGTRPRAADPQLDAALADDLVTSAKDRAENVMIVDLERNDLGRVCRYGSIRVPELAELEGHPTVWHLVSSVVGELRPDVRYGGLLGATFPCGSITGAPKLAAMTIIERLERFRRGWYCGAVGYMAPGRARFSVAIRTATLHSTGLVEHPAGGGIVAGSDPHAEFEESLDKAAAFLRAVSAGPAIVDEAAATIPESLDRTPATGSSAEP